MKKIFVVIAASMDGKNYAFADTIPTGGNLLAYLNRYPAHVVHLCDSRMQAEQIALAWNQAYKENGTNLY